MTDTTGICGESDSLLPEANEHPARHAKREKDRKKERDRNIKLILKCKYTTMGETKKRQEAFSAFSRGYCSLEYCTVKTPRLRAVLVSFTSTKCKKSRELYRWMER